jgi:phosphatidylinositol kinase/protein kinase (PI-3  family)
VKDRHNRNILIDSDGHIIHIDFGFIFGGNESCLYFLSSYFLFSFLFFFFTLDSPGFNINYEKSPFKLTKEYVDLLGGFDSPMFQLYEELFIKGLLALQKHADGIISIIQVSDGSLGCCTVLSFVLYFFVV